MIAEDLRRHHVGPHRRRREHEEEKSYATHSTTPDKLPHAIVEKIAPQGRYEQDGGFITSLRHEQLLKESREALEQARNAAMIGIPHEMLLLDLYAALRPIDAITGATTADDILNRIIWHSVKGHAPYPSAFVGTHGDALAKLGLIATKSAKSDDDD